MLLLCSRRYKAPPGAPAPKPAAERKTFEGIKLEPPAGAGAGGGAAGGGGGGAGGGGAAAARDVSLCEQCHSEEVVRHAAGLKSRLPASVSPHDLTVEKLEPVSRSERAARPAASPLRQRCAALRAFSFLWMSREGGVAEVLSARCGWRP